MLVVRTRRVVFSSALLVVACAKQDRGSMPPSQDSQQVAQTTADGETAKSAEENGFIYKADQFADIKVLRYQVPGFEELSLQQKKLLYYLYQAALSGRDILWDQNYRHNLAIRKTLEALLQNPPQGAKQDPQWKDFEVYAKRVFFSNGIHHHYSMKKIMPAFDQAWFSEKVKAVDPAKLPLAEKETVDAFVAKLTPVMFDPKVDAKRVNLDPEADLIASSATNYYGPNVKQKDVERFYAKRKDKKDKTPISHGLNSQLVKDKKGLRERVWKVGGMYDPAISEIVSWLEKASSVAENEAQKAALDKLIEYYKTGDLETFDEYSIAWVKDTDSRIDVVNGFIEVYGDPMGYRGAYESVVSIRDLEASKRIDAIGKEAQWFEDKSPIPADYKKKSVQGISAKVINAVIEAGDAAPSTPIGINLPNSNWIRAEHGSKSVNLGNIVHAGDESAKQSGVLEEFASSPEEVARGKKFGDLADKLHTDMHEVIGHASGKLAPGVGTPKETLKNYSSTLEEGRADLVALYYLMDPKLVEIGVMKDLETGKAAYDDYIRNGMLVQLARLELGEDVEESHMRNRQMIAKWAYEKGKPGRGRSGNNGNVIERIEKDGKTYFVVRDYEKLRELFGQLLSEVQRIKSEGDYKAGKALIETYGVKVDRELHEQVKERYAALDIAPYSGFIQPRLVPVEENGEIIDVKIEYPDDFLGQMLEYGEDYALLPVEN